MLFSRAAVDLSPSTLNYVAGVIRRHRKAIGSAWRLLNPGRQALLVLAHLRKGETHPQLAAGFEVSASTAWRYVQEAVHLLSARSPKLAAALRKAERDEQAHLVLDGTLIRTDRVAADRPYFSGKHRCHGMNVQVIADADGSIVWTSGAMPGSIHDVAAAKVWGISRALARCSLLVLVDKGYLGADELLVPYRGRGKPASQKQANRSHAKLRAPANAPWPSSRAGNSYTSSAAALPRPATSSKPSPSWQTAKQPEDEMGSLPARAA